ncbi:MAG TPA: magnesium/cobalt efflux protein [Gammaproteobacteria bacterium]|nr:magnesium/cobalt efflux protein [Gammaproteobacteria bacterium]|tara:strand:+ start:5419 stop:6306 length:888 start_codon:yes stop_codon:yes gene_type:complete
MSDISEVPPGSEAEEPPRRGVREWLADLFSDEPENLADLKDVLRHAAQRQLIEGEVLNILFGALQVSDMHARDIMIPRSALVVVQEDQTPTEFLPVVLESRHSRFPVIGEDLDDIKGILHAKDLLPLVLAEPSQRFAMKDSIRPAAIIPESKRLNVLLDEFRSNRNHMALVVDEYGQISGAITIEDVLEQIVGDIEDEHDVNDDSYIKQMEDNCYHVKATTTIDDFNDYFGSQLSDEEFDTIGGIVLQAFGHLPERGESVSSNGFDFEVLNADSRRVRLLRVDIASPAPSDGNSE